MMNDGRRTLCPEPRTLNPVFPFILHPSSFILLLALFAAGLSRPACSQTTSGPAVQAPPEPDRIERLRMHNIAPTPAVLTGFLQNGFPRGTRLTDLPTTPALKSQVVIDAVVEVSRQRVMEASPILGRLALGLPSDGIRTIIQWDAAQQRPGERAAFETDLMKRLRHNAVVALGLIGDPKRLYELAVVFDHEKDPNVKIPCALALSSVGSRQGLSYLIGEVGRANRTTSVVAGEALKYITGHDFGPAVDDAVARRNAAAADWKKWWKADGKLFRPDGEQIRARRLTPPIRPNPRVPRTVRDLVDCYAYENDPRWTIEGYDAYERLRLLGPDAFDDLEKILADKSESLRIRRQAIILYAQMTTIAYTNQPRVASQPARAYKAIKRLRWDSNPEIREAVKQWLPRLRKAR